MFGKKNEVEPSGEFFTVFDSKAKNYREPFPAPNSEVVIRDFVTAFRKPDAAEKNQYYQNAEDFSLFKCASFSLKTGEVTGCPLEHVANLHDLRALAAPRALSTT